MNKIYNKRNNNVPSAAIYIGRPSKWGNPFIMTNDTPYERDRVIQLFKKYAIKRLLNEPNWLTPLKNKDLVCWCSPKPCHAEVLIDLLKGVTNV